MENTAFYHMFLVEAPTPLELGSTPSNTDHTRKTRNGKPVANCAGTDLPPCKEDSPQACFQGVMGRWGRAADTVYALSRPRGGLGDSQKDGQGWVFSCSWVWGF